tara:strand:+ start:1238 stop:1588 length:351 start_codon:yes stop_codon:yes gene_type:complete
MKISIAILEQIIEEELAKVLQENPNDPTKIKTQATSTAAYKSDALGRVAAADANYTSIEKGFVTQIEDFLSKLAATPGVDLPKYRPQLQTLLKRLQAMVEPDIEQPASTDKPQAGK